MLNNYIRNSLIIILSVITLTIVNFDITTSNDLESFLEYKYKDKYPLILDYTDIDVVGLHLLSPRYIRDFKVDKKFEGSTKQKIISMISYVNSFPYNRYQGEPAFIKTKGGNCQAKSLYFKACLDNEKIENKIEHTKKHMYNIVVVNGKNIKIDLVTGKITGGNLHE